MSRTRKKILIVDDEESVRLIVKRFLEDLDQYTLVTASDGAEALAIASREHPDLILLDIDMPKMNGLEALRKLKEETATLQIPIIMLTALDDEEIMEEAISGYAEQYLTKPLDMDDLKIAVSRTLSWAFANR